VEEEMTEQEDEELAVEDKQMLQDLDEGEMILLQELENDLLESGPSISFSLYMVNFKKSMKLHVLGLILIYSLLKHGVSCSF